MCVLMRSHREEREGEGRERERERERDEGRVKDECGSSGKVASLEGRGGEEKRVKQE